MTLQALSKIRVEYDKVLLSGLGKKLNIIPDNDYKVS